MPAEIRSTSHGQTMVLTLHNPALRNALDPSMYGAGVEALNAAGDNPEVRSVVIVGEGGTFCSGGNLRRLQAERQQPRPAEAEGIDGLHLWIEEIRTFPKPVIAAVEGTAAGAGFSLALACDFIVASRTAQFAMAQAKVGLSPDGGGSWHLAQDLPRQLVNEIAMLGDSLPADRLHALGIVNRLAPTDGALAEALALAGRLNALAGNALGSVKELVSQSAAHDLTAHLLQEREHFVRNLHHANAGVGIAALLERTTPVFA